MHGISKCTVNRETLNTVYRVKTDFWGKEKCTVNRDSRDTVNRDTVNRETTVVGFLKKLH